MKPNATIVRRSAAGPNRRTHPLTLPHDLLQKVRSRVKLVAILLMIGFIVDPAIHLVVWATSQMTGGASPTVEALPLATNLVAIAISLVVWAIARSPRVSQTRLLEVGLTFEVLICLVVSLDTHEYFLTQAGELPHLTWVIAIIILFPLIIPSPPRSMLLAAIAAALTSPLSLFILQVLGKYSLTKDDYLQASINPALAVVLAYFASRVVYGLSVDVVRARQMGSYHLVDLLGRGGMGEVWKAEHAMLARPAAIKLIPAEMLSSNEKESPEVVLRRFEAEAQATASLRSPNTIDLYDFGRADDGAFYYVMELLDGMDLEALVERYGPLPSERAVHLLRQVCRSLAEAHDKGLVHRDIKPANVFVCRYGLESDFVKVLDFGLVKSKRDTNQTDLKATAQNVVGGTPAFMAPEQALGREDADRRSDLYSLGCVAYWLLTGRMVFEAETAIEMITHHIQSTPAHPSMYAETAVPKGLDQLVLRCLEKGPADRPASAQALERELAAIEFPDDWTQERALRWWDVHQPVGRPGTASR